MPLLSVITICRNIARTIGPTCESISGQTYPDYEWIVVDGNSTDGTLDVLSAYRERMSVLISEDDDGIYNALNKGIRAATGEWIICINGGDMLASPDVLERMAPGLNGDADIVYGDTLLAREGRVVKPLRADRVEDAGKLFFVTDNINHQSAFIRRELFERYGLYDERYAIRADYEKWIVFAENNCRFEKKDIFVAVYDMDGLSSVDVSHGLSAEERKQIRKAHFSHKEIRLARKLEKKRSYTLLSRYGPLPGGASLLSVEESPNKGKRRYCFLGLPLLKLEYGRDGNAFSRALLFNSIPLPKAVFGLFALRKDTPGN